MQGWEVQFPCATWLPVIFQNPAEIPLTWQALLARSLCLEVLQPATASTASQKISHQAISFKLAKQTARVVLLVSLTITALLLGVRYLGWLQSFELAVFDQLLQQRPDELPDSRLLVVTVTETDLKAQAQPRQGSLSDAALAQVLEKLEAYQPRVIGLDIYRDYPAKQRQLAERMGKSDRFVAVCKVSNASISGVAPPPEVNADHLGFSDLAIDADHIVRRHLLALDPPPDSPCSASYAFSTQLALGYLAQQGIELQFMPDGAWKLGTTVIKPLEAHSGGYQGIDAWGHQTLLNYRSYGSVSAIAPQITLSQVLAGQLNAETVKDRIVVIGTTAESFHDVSLTPYKTPQGEAQTISGVIIQAQLISQLLSAVLDQRSLLWVLPLWIEAFWILGWALAGSLLGLLHRPKFWGLAIVVMIIALYSASLGLLILLSCWIPLVPAALALLGSSGSTFLLTNSLAKKPKNE